MPWCRFELGRVPPTIEDVRVFPGTDPGAEDIFLEFDFHWKGDQNISLLLNPTPKFMQSVPGLSTLVNKIFTWTVRFAFTPRSLGCTHPFFFSTQPRHSPNLFTYADQLSCGSLVLCMHVLILLPAAS